MSKNTTRGAAAAALPSPEIDAMKNQRPPPDATNFRTDVEYARKCFEDTGLGFNEVGRRIGQGSRIIRYYVSGERPWSYPVQYAIECLKGEGTGAPADQVVPEPKKSHGTKWYTPDDRELREADVGSMVVIKTRFGEHAVGKVDKDGFGLWVQDMNGLPTHRFRIDQVKCYTLLDGPPSNA